MHKTSLKLLVVAVTFSLNAMEQKIKAPDYCSHTLNSLQKQSFEGDSLSREALEVLEKMEKYPTYKPASPEVVRVLHANGLITDEGDLDEGVAAAVLALRKKSGN